MTDNAIDIGLRQSMQDQVKKKVLWENASPGSSFAEQKITIPDILNYDYTDIDYKPTTTSPTRKCERTPIETDGSGTLVGFLNLGSNSATASIYRTFDIASDGITFKDCEYKSGQSGNASVVNTYNIPLTIYGIKVVGGVIRKLKTLAVPIFLRWEVA